MGRKNKVTKKVIGFASGSAVSVEEVDGSTEEFAAAGMGLQELPAAAAEGSGGESMVPGDAAPRRTVRWAMRWTPIRVRVLTGRVSRLRLCSHSSSKVLRFGRASRNMREARSGWARAMPLSVAELSKESIVSVLQHGGLLRAVR